MNLGLIGFLLSLVAISQCEVEVEEGVLVLTEDNFDEAVEANSLILVEFYAPWCGHCKKLAPEYESAAKLLSEASSPVKLAKVDATEQKGLSTKFSVKGFPTLKFFKDGRPMEYTGGRTADTIVTWVNKKSGPAALTLETAEAADQLVNSNKVAVLGFFKDLESDEAKAFLKAADSLDDKVFGITSVDELLAKYEAKDKSIVLLKKFDEGRNVLEGDISLETVIGFVNVNSFPLVAEFSMEISKQIFASGIAGHFLMFCDPEDVELEGRINIARNIAKDYKGEVMFVSVSNKDPQFANFLQFLGVPNDAPTFRLVKVSEDFLKFQPESDQFTEDNIRAFIGKVNSGDLQPYLKSEDVPEDWNSNPVKVLVGKNFVEVAMDETKDVLVEFYAPWCGHCKKLIPIWDELGEKFKDHDDIVIAKMDSTANEAKGIKIKGFPTIKLFKRGDNSEVQYSGDRSLEALAKFLRPDQAEPATESAKTDEKDEL